MYNINIFFVYSIIGFIYESIFNLINEGTFKSGFLYGPYTPIYGIGVLIILCINNKLKKYSKTKRYILLPIISSLILTSLEFICGNLLETLFHRYYWNYSNLYFSFGKYIALEVSIVWGLVSYLVIFINSKIEKYIKKIPKPITIILSIIFIIDLVFTFITNL